MSDEILNRDQNHITVLGGITDDSNQFITMLRVDPVTKRLLISATGLPGGGTVTSVSVVTANGISGSVANATTTPAITLTLGAITPTSINGASSTEVGYLVGVTSAIQTQINAKGTGTVTSVSVVTANGVSGSVATSTTTPAITLTLGAITPTTVNGNTISTGSGVLTLGAGKTATISNTLTFTGTDASSVAFGTGGTVLYNGGALGTPSSGVATNLTGTASGLTAGTVTTNANLTGDVTSSGNATTLATVNSNVGSFTNANITVNAKGLVTAAANGTSGGMPTTMQATIFETAGRFVATMSNGTVTYGTSGAQIDSTSTGGRYIQLALNNPVSFLPYANSPIFTTSIENNCSGNASAAGASFFGIGTPTIAVGGYTFTPNHIGFKILRVAGVMTLYATQADGSTENASTALTTTVNGDFLDLIVKVNGTSSVDYYYRKGTASSYSTVNLTTNIPSTSAVDATWTIGATNSNTAFSMGFNLFSASYER